MKTKPSDTVYISTLNYKRDRRGLTTLFAPFGKIHSIRIIVDPETEQSKGMAFVKMGSVKEATTAIKALHGQVIDGRTVKARFAIPQDEAARDKKEVKEKKSDFRSVQLAKKERNEKRRKSNPLVFKAPSKKKTPPK